MTHEEKVLLKEEIAKAVPKEIHELLANSDEEMPDNEKGLLEENEELDVRFKIQFLFHNIKIYCF